MDPLDDVGERIDAEAVLDRLIQVEDHGPEDGGGRCDPPPPVGQQKHTAHHGKPEQTITPGDPEESLWPTGRRNVTAPVWHRVHRQV